MTLDVIVMVSRSTPAQWVSQSVASVFQASRQAGYEVRLHITKGVPGHIGQAMLGSLRRCTADWVAWVDDDDYVAPDAFSCLQRHFAAAPTAVCAREVHVLANGMSVPQHGRHHLTAYCRDAIRHIDLSLYPSRPNVALLQAVDQGAADESSWIYFHRKYRSAGLRLRGQTTVAELELLA